MREVEVTIDSEQVLEQLDQEDYFQFIGIDGIMSFLKERMDENAIYLDIQEGITSDVLFSVIDDVELKEEYEKRFKELE